MEPALQQHVRRLERGAAEARDSLAATDERAAAVDAQVS